VHLLGSADVQIQAYSDVDWACCLDTRRSTSGYYVFIDDLLVAWSSKRQMTVSRSSAEAKYNVVANATIECCKRYMSSSTRQASYTMTTSLRFTYRGIQFITGG
jgi:hypothetical protein